MFKDYLKQKKISVYSLSHKAGISYSTLNDFVNEKVPVDQCRAGMIRKVAEALGISMDALYDLATYEPLHIMTSYGVECVVTKHSKRYHVVFDYGGKTVDLPVCRITDDTKYYIEDVAKWHAEDYIRDEHMKEFGEGKYDGLLSDEER